MLPKLLGELSSCFIGLHPQGLKYIVIQGYLVAIVENKIDATTICNIAGSVKAARNKQLNPLR